MTSSLVRLLEEFHAREVLARLFNLLEVVRDQLLVVGHALLKREDFVFIPAEAEEGHLRFFGWGSG